MIDQPESSVRMHDIFRNISYRQKAADRRVGALLELASRAPVPCRCCYCVTFLAGFIAANVEQKEQSQPFKRGAKLTDDLDDITLAMWTAVYTLPSATDLGLFSVRTKRWEDPVPPRVVPPAATRTAITPVI